MKNLKQISLALAIIAGLMYSGCNNSGGKKESENEVVKIGVILPLTGELSSYSEPMKQGMEMAVKKINLENDLEVELIYTDSKAEAKTAVSALQKMISINKIKYFIGDISSTTTLAMIPVIESSNSFLLSPGASSPRLTGISDLFARNYPSSLDESIKSAEFAFNELKAKRVSIVYVNSEYGTGLKDAFHNKFINIGGTIVTEESYPFENTNFRTLVVKLKNANPDMIYLAGNQKEMGNFIKQLKESGFNPYVISNISFLEPDCLNIAQEAADGVIVPLAHYDPTDTTFSKAYTFAIEFRKTQNTDPSVAVAVGYDAVTLLYDAILEKGDNVEKVAQHIRNIKNYNGALGVFSIEDGDINMKTVFKVVKNGKPVNYKK